jgi:hypothetical protein
MRQILRRGNCVLFLFLATATGQATTLARMSLEQLAAAASVVIRGRCLANQSRWEGGEIWTFTDFEVLESWKGAAQQLITIRLLGGRQGPLVSRVEGVPRFEPGEEAVLFLEPARAGGLSVTAWAEGTFRIRRDRQTGAPRVSQDTAAVAAFDPLTRRFYPGGIRNLPLEEFRARVLVALGDASPARER